MAYLRVYVYGDYSKLKKPEDFSPG